MAGTSSRLNQCSYGLATLTASNDSVYNLDGAFQVFGFGETTNFAHACDDGSIGYLGVRSLQGPVLVKVRTNRRFFTWF